MMVCWIESAVADHLRVRLEVALRGDHLHELFGHVDVRALERARLHETEAGVAGLAAQRLARRVGLGPLRVAELLQALRVGEVRDGDLAERLRVAVREPGLHDAGVADVDADQPARREAVLRHRVHGEVAAELRRLREIHRDVHVGGAGGRRERRERRAVHPPGAVSRPVFEYCSVVGVPPRPTG